MRKLYYLVGVICVFCSAILLFYGNGRHERISLEENGQGVFVIEKNLKMLLQVRNEIDSVFFDEDELKEVLQKEYRAAIVIDAGHGGYSTGTFSWKRKYPEKEINLKIVKQLKSLLDPLEEQGVKIYYTRLEDREVSLKKRVNLMKKKKADFFVSIHCNGDLDRSTNGFEILYCGKKHKGEKFSAKKMARICQMQLTRTFPLEDRGIVERNDLYILNQTKMPGIIVELGFMSNENDMKALKKEKHQKEAAEAVYQSILQYLKPYVIEEEA